jgi:hypothetical protein
MMIWYIRIPGITWFNVSVRYQKIYYLYVISFLYYIILYDNTT